MRVNRSLLAVAALPLLGGCHWLVVGDSISAISAPVIADVMPGDGKIDGDPGRNVDTHDFAVDTHRTALWRNLHLVEPGGWVILQDDGTDATYASTRRWVLDASRLVPDDRCIAWVLPVDDTVAAAIRDHADAQPCHSFADWGAAVDDNPNLLHDHVHPNVAGVHVLADLIREATS